MSQPTVWDKVKTGGKAGFDKGWKALDKLGAPVNKLSNKLGSEAFWPTTLDKESDKAARILKTFCKDGFYQEEETQPVDGPKQKQKVVKKIPTNVIKNAKGLAIFTTMRTGLWVSGAGGSGILIARKEDGSWSPPSGILLHTAGLGFLVGVDIYDCVVVINTYEALEAFTKIRCTLGSEISVAAGPVGAGGVLDTELHKRQAPIFTYLKSRGFYAGVQIDGTVVIERTDENERFYGQKIPVKEILAGKVTHPPYEIRRLLETIKAAQGDSDVDESILPTEAPPSDFEVDNGQVFGVPDKEDPDPYGVLALEKEGMSIKEAGTQKRASWEAFSFHPAPSSPVHAVYARQSGELPRSSVSRRSSWRNSALANGESKTPSSLRNSMEFPPPPKRGMAHPPGNPPVGMVEASTQTEEVEGEGSPQANRWSGQSFGASHSRGGSKVSLPMQPHMQEVPEDKELDTTEPVKTEPESASHANGYTTPPHTPPLHGEKQQPDDDADEDTAEDAHIEEPIVHSVQTVQSTAVSPQAISKARIVTVPKRAPPKLPPRNPNRSAGPMVIDASPVDAASTADEDVFAAPADSKHDSADAENAEAQKVGEKLDEVRLDDDDEDDEEVTKDPWAKVEEARKKQAEEEHHSPTAAVPGAFE